MAIYHFHVGVVSRKTGRSAVAASAYRSAEKLKSDYDGITHDYEKSSVVNTSAYISGERLNNERNSKTHDYTRKRGVVHTEIMLPHNAPREYIDRATLWNAVERAEKRKDAQTARDIDVALPVELGRVEQIELMREYIQENFTQKGMIADFAIHDKSDGNPHAHILLTTREVSEGGFGKKNRAWNNKDRFNSWRENWASACNERLEVHKKRIDHRTLKAQGIDREPTIHIGVEGKALERKGIITERVRKNREIITRNKAKESHRIAEQLHELKEKHYIISKEISELQAVSTETLREMNIARFTAEEISERAENIQAVKSRLDELRYKRRSMGIFTDKKFIDNEIQQIERTHEHTTAYFKKTYKVDPEQAGAEVARLEKIAENKSNLHIKIQDKLKPLKEQQELTLFEYQKQKMLVEIRADKQGIHNSLSELEKESKVYKNLVRDDVLRLRCNRQLDVVTQPNFEKIIQSVTPKQAEAFIQKREFERVRERERARNIRRFR